jgi:glycosyltransferase involved in cell wall biosynthesis
MAKLPFVLVGDHPENPTGLGRILGDLARQIHRDFGDVLDVRIVGWVPWAGLPEHGTETDGSPTVAGIPLWAFNATQKKWGADAVIHAYRQWFGNRDGILFSVWDPSRCLAFSMIPLPVIKWGYFAVDAENVNGGISGPAAQAIRAYDRVLAYGEFGSKVLMGAYRGLVAGRQFPHLPHGIHCNVFQPLRSLEDRERAARILRVPEGRQVIGCVATNHTRKDWGMVARALSLMVAAGHNVHGWWHTDRIVSEAWSLPQLAMDLGLEDRVTYTTALDDNDLARCYAACAATIAPGRGEGFGYPIVESLSCGTPAYHVQYGGGWELLPPNEPYQLSALTYHLVGPYALRRPIVSPKDVAVALSRYVNGLPTDANLVAERARCRAHALKYDWGAVWPRWQLWIKQGIGQGKD